MAVLLEVDDLILDPQGRVAARSVLDRLAEPLRQRRRAGSRAW